MSASLSRPLVDVQLEGISGRDGAHGPIEDVTLHVRHGEFFTILGGQRSGKSMVLRVIAGFARAAGRVLIEG